MEKQPRYGDWDTYPDTMGGVMAMVHDAGNIARHHGIESGTPLLQALEYYHTDRGTHPDNFVDFCEDVCREILRAAHIGGYNSPNNIRGNNEVPYW